MNPIFHDITARMVSYECGIHHIYFITLSSKSSAIVNPNGRSTATNFEFVTVSEGENLINGGIEKTFYCPEIEYAVPFFSVFQDLGWQLFSTFKVRQQSVWSNTNELEGKIIKERHFERRNGILLKSKEVLYNYTYSTPNGPLFGYRQDSIPNVAIQKVMDCMRCIEETGYNYHLSFYKKHLFKPFLFSKSTTEYIERPSITAYTDTYFSSGWEFGDHDSDGDFNYEDTSYPPLSEQQFDDQFKSIKIDESYSFVSNYLAGMPDKITTTESNGSVREQRFLYPIPSDIDDLAGLNSDQAAAYAHLFAENRISSPIHESTHNGNDVTFQKRTYYKLADYQLTQSTTGQTAVVSEVHGAKGTNPLEPRIYFNEYDNRANPTEVSMPGGASTVYIWSPQRRPLLKVDNANYSIVLQALQSAGIDTNTSGLNYSQMTGIKNALSAVAPTAQITSFDYIFPESLLYKVMAPNGDITTYIYDEFKRLKHVKDSQGNILEHYEYHYLTQN